MSACFTSVQAYNGCAGFRPGDSDPRQNMPQQRIWQQRIWKPVPWSPSVPKTKSAKQQRKAALNTNDVFSAESLVKHKVSIADVLLSEPQAPASPAKREACDQAGGSTHRCTKLHCLGTTAFSNLVRSRRCAFSRLGTTGLKT